MLGFTQCRCLLLPCIGKFDQNFKALHGLFIGTTTYIINSGQEPKTEYFYEKVETGQGDYIYIGNPDSTLINANFRYAPDLGTANYIRLTLINNEFITTNNQSISQSLRIEPAQILREKDSKGAKFLKRFASIHTFRVTKKTEDQEGGDNGFFNFSTDSPNLVSYTSLINNTLFYNRGNPQFDLQLGNKSSQNIYTQISGREDRGISEYFTRARIRVMSSSDLILQSKYGAKTYASELIPSRDFDIQYYQINPEISIRPSSSFRVGALYTYVFRDQQINNQERAISHDFTINSTYRQSSNSNINASLSFVQVKYNGEANSPIEFDLLEGLKNGQNFIWNFLFTKRLSNNIDLNINYEGRKNGDSPVVHIARAQVKATF